MIKKRKWQNQYWQSIHRCSPVDTNGVFLEETRCVCVCVFVCSSCSKECKLAQVVTVV
jgi:hypothetical protein